MGNRARSAKVSSRKAASWRPRLTPISKTLATSSFHSPGTQAPLSLSCSNTRRIASVVSPL